MRRAFRLCKAVRSILAPCLSTPLVPSHRAVFNTPSSTPFYLTSLSVLAGSQVSMSSTSASDSSTTRKVPDLLKKACVVNVPRGSKHKFTLIWIHGLGDSGENNASMFEGIPNTRVVLPNAPERAITANYGEVMPGWYDIYSFSNTAERNLNSKQDKEGIMASMKALEDLIEYEAATLRDIYEPVEKKDDDPAFDAGAARVIVGGFSQGGACTLLVGHRYPKRLGGLICASGYLLLHSEIDQHMKTKDVPLLMYHGVADPIVPVTYARASASALKAAGVTITSYTEEPRLPHSFSPTEMKQISQFLSARFNDAEKSTKLKETAPDSNAS